MTDFIQTIARAMIEADPAISGYHQSHIDLMVRRLNAVLTAINEAGYAVVPRVPTEAMVIVGGRICADLSSGRASQPYEDDAREAYRAMIAAITTGKAE